MAEKDSTAPETAQILLGKLRALAEANELATFQEWETLQKQWSATLRTDEENTLFETLGAPLRERFAAEAAHDAEVREKAENLIGELAALCEKKDVETLRLRKAEIEKAVAGLGRLPREYAKRYREYRRRASEMLALFFDTLDFARWESYTLKLDICKELETLGEATGPALVAAAKKLQELRAKWKTLGSVPKEKLDESNSRYLELTRSLQHRIDEYFSGRRQMQKEAAAAKAALCEEIESLRDSTDWRTVSDRIKQMQTQWKELPRCGSAENELFTRFHTAADAFFSARAAFYAGIEAKYAEAEKGRLALIAEAEALAPGDVRAAKALREKFNASPNAGREEIKLRKKFDEIMDKFFAQRREEFSRRDAEAEALVTEWTTLLDHPVENAGRAREIAEKLRATAPRRIFDEVKKLQRDFSDALAAEEERRRRDAREKTVRAADEWMTIYVDVRAGKSVETLPDIPETLSRIAPFARLVSAAAAGDADAAQKAEKQLRAAQKEAENILESLENAAGCKPEKPLDLAAELQAAILGNSGFGGDPPKKNRDFSRDFAAFEAILWLDPENRSALRERFEKVKKLLAE
ncbi:MAG: DUF349 domain-containing protein [Victivallaceae bacterium]|nr:DUF349 domain-containing protein [Victivallaceae bacterium]